MRILREIGYEYKGWKLGEKVRCKDDGEKYIIVGFDESGDCGFIAINRAYTSYNIEISENATSYIKTDSPYFEWTKQDEIEKMEGNMKKEVLILEYQDVFDEKVAVRIVCQDENVLRRGEFEDKDIGVYSVDSPAIMGDKLFILGDDRECDYDIFMVSKEEAEAVKDKVKKINEKYGEKIKSRGKYGDVYYYIESVLEVKCTKDDFYYADNKRYLNGNYFKTKEQAEEVVKKFKNVLKEVE